MRGIHGTALKVDAKTRDVGNTKRYAVDKSKEGKAYNHRESVWYINHGYHRRRLAMGILLLLPFQKQLSAEAEPTNIKNDTNEIYNTYPYIFIYMYILLLVFTVLLYFVRINY